MRSASRLDWNLSGRSESVARGGCVMERQAGVFRADQSVDASGPHAASPIFKEGKDWASDRAAIAMRHCDRSMSAGTAQHPFGKSRLAQRGPADWVSLRFDASRLGVVRASRARAN